MTIADTSGLLALINRSDPAHGAVSEFVTQAADPLVVSTYVIAELDYLVARRVSVQAELEVLMDLAGGSYDLAHVDATDLARTCDVIGRYADQAIGVTDASIVILADRYRTREILTLDHRHFDVVRPLSGGRFKIVP